MSSEHSPERKVQVVLVEDHDEFRASLEYFLNTSGRIECRSFARCDEALEGIARSVPDAVIMDIHLPDEDGIVCTRQIKERWPGVQVMICTVHEDDEKIFNALRAGATGYLLKRSSVEDLIEALDQMLEGGSPMSPAIARRVVGSFRPTPMLDAGAGLTPREQEVLDLMATGRRVKEIAAQLFVSPNTIRTHIRHIYEKLQVQGRVEAVNKMRR